MIDFYKNCPCPKPADKAKRKKQNGYKNKPKRTCYYHPGRRNAERHEVYGGNPNRQISIDHGFQVDLCPECHKEMQANITDQAKERNQFWRRYYQEVYERKLIDASVSKEQARSLWMLLIGKNYKEDIL